MFEVFKVFLHTPLFCWCPLSLQFQTTTLKQACMFGVKCTFCAARGCFNSCGFPADHCVSSVDGQVGRGCLSVCVYMAGAYSGISSSHISHKAVDLCACVSGSGVGVFSLWGELCLVYVLFFVWCLCYWLYNSIMCVKSWSGLCSQVVVKQLTHICIIRGHGLSTDSAVWGFCFCT